MKCASKCGCNDSDREESTSMWVIGAIIGLTICLFLWLGYVAFDLYQAFWVKV